MGNDHQQEMGTDKQMQEVFMKSNSTCVCYRGEGDNELIRELDLLAHRGESL